MYADVLTGSIQAAIRRDRAPGEPSRRPTTAEHGITPASIVKDIDEVLSSVYERDYVSLPSVGEAPEPFMSLAEIDARIQQLNRDMKAAAANLEFEKARVDPRRDQALARPEPRGGRSVGDRRRGPPGGWGLIPRRAAPSRRVGLYDGASLRRRSSHGDRTAGGFYTGRFQTCVRRCGRPARHGF